MKILFKKVKEDPNIKIISDYFGVSEKEIKKGEVDTYFVKLADDYGKSQYKKLNKYGNSSIPGRYDFSEPILVRVEGGKLFSL